MTRLDIRLWGAHRAKVQELETQFVGRHGTNKSVNFEALCVCGWRSPSRFRARVAAELAAKEHGDALGDLGYVEFTLRGLTGEEAERSQNRGRHTGRPPTSRSRPSSEQSPAR